MTSLFIVIAVCITIIIITVLMLTLGKPLGNFDSVLTSTSAIGLQRRVVNNFQGGNRELRQHWLHKLQEVKAGRYELTENEEQIAYQVLSDRTHG